MCVSMSAIGSVITPTLKPPCGPVPSFPNSLVLPAGLDHARDLALVGELAQADPAQPELPEDGARTPAPPAARVLAHLELGLALPLNEQRLLRQRRPPSSELPRAAAIPSGAAARGPPRRSSP